MDGWVKLHRALLKKPIWQMSTPQQKTILITLLLMANHDENKWEWNGEQYHCQAGQFITSLDNIVKECGKGVSVQNVRTSLKRFEKYDFLTNESTKTGRLITIVNWGSYQVFDAESNNTDNSCLTSDQQTPNKRLTPNKKEKNNNIYIDHFDAFWKAYPKKVGKEPAQKSFKKIKVDEKVLGDMLAAIEREKMSKQWQDKQYIPNPTTWLNQRRWKDETEEPGQDSRVTVTSEGTYRF
ncbi:MAG: hypothetical protein K0R92_435 [Lachnospiraceae bacterium]|nr:hypothetical protein [Lachnospiraceae bacterium]